MVDFFIAAWIVVGFVIYCVGAFVAYLMVDEMPDWPLPLRIALPFGSVATVMLLAIGTCVGFIIEEIPEMWHEKHPPQHASTDSEGAP